MILFKTVHITKKLVDKVAICVMHGQDPWVNCQAFCDGRQSISTVISHGFSWHGVDGWMTIPG